LNMKFIDARNSKKNQTRKSIDNIYLKIDNKKFYYKDPYF